MLPVWHVASPRPSGGTLLCKLMRRSPLVCVCVCVSCWLLWFLLLIQPTFAQFWLASLPGCCLMPHTHDALLITWLIAAHNGRAVNLSLFVCVPCVCVFTPVVVSPCPCVCLQQRRPYWPCLGCFFVCLPVAATHAYVLPADFPSDCNCFEEQLVTHTQTQMSLAHPRRIQIGR